MFLNDTVQSLFQNSAYMTQMRSAEHTTNQLKKHSLILKYGLSVYDWTICARMGGSKERRTDQRESGRYNLARVHRPNFPRSPVCHSRRLAQIVYFHLPVSTAKVISERRGEGQLERSLYAGRISANAMLAIEKLNECF